VETVTLLDGALGTELQARGVPTEAPMWSAWALDHAPEVVAAIHRDYAAAGATVHTADTFRTRRLQAGPRWPELARRAVSLARAAIPPDHRVAGSIAPVADCYRPDLSPPDAEADHRAIAAVLAEAGVDLLLCETFPDVAEGLVAVDAAVASGVETWVAFTAGPGADLLTPREIGEAGRRAVDRGARAVLVKGGHGSGAEAIDVLVTRDGVRVFAGRRVGTPHTHGTGCTLSSAIAALRARGLDLADAVGRAKTIVRLALEAGRDLGVGHGHGPVDHLYATRRLDLPPAE
jgi:hypothetical protein